MASWPRPERLLPPELVEALEASRAGDATRAVALAKGIDVDDPFAGDVVRLVRARAALDAGDHTRARADLLELVAGPDHALAVLASEALVEDLIRRRRFATAQRLLRRFRTPASDTVTRLWSEATSMAIDLHRHGTVPAVALDALARRVERAHPPLVHASVHVLRAERALLAGELRSAVEAAGEARPFVRASRDAAVSHRYEVVTRLLRAPCAEAEDWEEPRRPVSREDLAVLEAKPWQLWIDMLHHRVLRRTARHTGATALEIDPVGATWDLLEALASTARLRLAWSQACAVLAVGDSVAGRARAERTARELRAAALPVRVGGEGLRLDVERFVLVFATTSLPRIEQQLLARLAASPGATSARLMGTGSAHRTILRHLARLRQHGHVRMVGGGNEARYFLV